MPAWHIVAKCVLFDSIYWNIFYLKIIEMLTFLLYSDPNKFRLSDDKKTLTVYNVTKPADIMCVQCEVSNDVDSVMANACLNVICKYHIDKMILAQIFRNSGFCYDSAMVTLSLVLISNPHPLYKVVELTGK